MPVVVIDIEKYEFLVRQSERLEAAGRLFKSSAFVSEAELKAVLRFEEGEKKNEAVRN